MQISLSPELIRVIDDVRNSNELRHMSLSRPAAILLAMHIFSKNPGRFSMSGAIIGDVTTPAKMGRPPKDPTAEGTAICDSMDGTIDPAGYCKWTKYELTPTGRKLDSKLSKHITKLTGADATAQYSPDKESFF